MKKVPLTDLRGELGHTTEEVALTGSPILVTRNNKPHVIIAPHTNDIELLIQEHKTIITMIQSLDMLLQADGKDILTDNQWLKQSFSSQSWHTFENIITRHREAVKTLTLFVSSLNSEKDHENE